MALKKVNNKQKQTVTNGNSSQQYDKFNDHKIVLKIFQNPQKYNGGITKDTRLNTFDNTNTHFITNQLIWMRSFRKNLHLFILLFFWNPWTSILNKFNTNVKFISKKIEEQTTTPTTIGSRILSKTAKKKNFTFKLISFNRERLAENAFLNEHYFKVILFMYFIIYIVKCFVFLLFLFFAKKRSFFSNKDETLIKLKHKLADNK